MTRKEIEDKIAELQKQLENAPADDTETAGATSSDSAGKTADTGSDKEINAEPKDEETADEERRLNSNDELEEGKQIEPQTNGAITDDIPAANVDENSPSLSVAVVPGPKSKFEESTAALEVAGTEAAVTVNYDEKFATIAKEYALLMGKIDKLEVAMSQILTRIDLVQEVTDKVVAPVTHDSLLAESIKLLV